jgi:hypothetical protein
MADPSEPTDPADPADPADPVDPTDPADAAEAEEERLGHRRSWFGRLRNHLGSVAAPTKHANEDTRAIGLQGDHPGWRGPL